MKHIGRIFDMTLLAVFLVFAAWIAARITGWA